MSKVTDMVQDEAVKAEAENPDEPTPDEPTPDEQEDEAAEAGELEPTPESEPEVNSDAQTKAIVSELGRHERAWAKLNGLEPEDLNACPTCEGVGFTMEPQPKIATAEYTRRCSTCNGYGEVLSGSLRQGNETVKCLTCQGMGYEDIREAAQLTQNGEARVDLTPVAAVDPEVEALRAKGYTIIEPFQVATP